MTDAVVLPPVTVAVPVLNRLDQMLRCLDAVLALDYPDFDVLVLDNGSVDGTREACADRGESAKVRIRVHEVEGTVGRLRNQAARLAAGRIIAFTDSDCLPQRGWLRSGVAPFRDPGVGVVTGPTLPEAHPTGAWAATQHITKQTWRFETCNALYRRDALLDSDGFDESVSMWEDTAAGWAVLRAGWEARFVPEAIVVHDVTYPGWLWHVRRVLRYGEAAVVVRRYPEMARRLLWARYFLRPREAAFVGLILALALGARDRRWTVLGLPYMAARGPRRLGGAAILESLQAAVFDAAVLVGMVRGSIRARRLLL